MTEEVLDDMTEDVLYDTMVSFNAAIAVGNYKKANKMLDILTAKKSKKNKMLEDRMVA